MLTRNLVLLTLCQLLSVSCTVIVVTLGGIIGNALSPDPTLATLPMSLMIVGTAIATVFASMLMGRVGRRDGFIIGAAISVAGAALAAAALTVGAFVPFCIGIALFGVNGAFVQQYRFAAAESVPAVHAATAISVILVGSIGGAFLGPWLATNATTGADARLAATYLPALVAIAWLQCLNAFVLLGLREPRIAGSTSTSDDVVAARPLGQIVQQPRYLIAVAGGMVGYATMTLIMTATPLDMHLAHGFSMADTSAVIRGHVLAMYLPSLVAGPLIAALGAPRVMLIGVVALLGTVFVGLQGQAYAHYWWALVLLGVGWNLLFVGGTALLMQTYRPNERYRAQAINEFSVFGASALASLLAGSAMHLLGWDALLLTVTPVLVALLLALVWLQVRDSTPLPEPAGGGR